MVPSRRSREQLYSAFGPLALLVLFIVWALLLILAYGLIFFGRGTVFADSTHPVSAYGVLCSSLYVSGTTLFTVDLGDVLPTSQIARILIVLESGTGLGS